MCAVFLVFLFGVLISSTGLPGAFPSFAPSFLVRSPPSTLYSEIILHFSFLGVPFPFLFFRSSFGLLLFRRLLACGRRLPRCRLVCSIYFLLHSVQCRYPPAPLSFGSPQLRLFLRRVAGSPAALMAPPPLPFPSRLWSSTLSVPLFRLRWSLLPFFFASLVLARLFRSFPALFFGPLLLLPFTPSGPLLLLYVWWLPSFFRSSVWGFFGTSTFFLSLPSQVSSFLCFVSRASVTSHSSASSYFVSGSSVLLVLISR